MAESLNVKYKIPTGLRSLLEALARETMRTQPDDLISFSQLFFEILQKHRTHSTGEDILKEPALYESFKNELQKEYKKKKNHLTERSPSPLDEAATKIQAAFRGHVVRAHPEKFGLDKTQAEIIRRRSMENINLLDTRKDLKRHSVGGYTLEMETPEDRAATIIQAEIRGFLTRRHVQQMKKEGDEAAKKIQAHIRGYLTRKHLDEAGIPRRHSVVSSSQSHDDLRKVL